MTDPAPTDQPPRKRRLVWLIIAVVIAILIALLAAGAWLGLERWAKTRFGGRAAVNLTIERGMSTRAIAARLRDAGLISHDLPLLAYLRLHRRQGHIQAGRYTLQPPLAPVELLELLQHGAFERSLTIPEGWTVAQIARRLREQGWIADEKTWLELAARPVPASLLGVEIAGAEGFCFPETYQLEEHSSPQTILSRMLGRFKQQWQACSPDQRDSRSRDLSVFQVVTLASMIEREARAADEMPLIASVYLNRLGKGMKLQCDATVYYALGKSWDEKLLFADLDIDHPYNTYRRAGLPPGPISNPSRAAIEAVLRPAANDFLYYVYNGGKHHVFSRTYAEHQAAVRAARKRLATADQPTTHSKQR